MITNTLTATALAQRLGIQPHKLVERNPSDYRRTYKTFAEADGEWRPKIRCTGRLAGYEFHASSK